MKIITSIILLILLSACVAPHDKFYTKITPAQMEVFLLPYSGHTEYVNVSSKKELDATSNKLLERGYAMLGYSSFEANAGDYSASLKSKATEVQADVVTVFTESAGTLNTVAPILNYTPGQNSTTYSSGTVNATAHNNYGATAYGTANYSGLSTTTSPGTFNTSYVPIQVLRLNNSALYWRKRVYIFGANYEQLTPEIRQQLEQNNGIVITLIVENTPAFLANILVGDIMLKIDGEAIISPDDFSAKSRQKAGRKVSIELIRKGVKKTIELQLGKMPHI